MKQKELNKLDLNIKEIEECFHIVTQHRLQITFSLQTILTSEYCIPIFNNTKEGNIFQTCLNSLYLNCIVNIRKILEPNKGKKKSNLDFLINTVYRNKDFFAQKHYDADYNKPRHSMDIYEEKGTYVPLELDEFKKCELAEPCREKCLKEIEKVNNKWDRYWNAQLGNWCFSLQKYRDNLVHSFKEYPVYLPSTDKLRRYLSVINWFLGRLEFIIMNSSSNRYELDQDIKTVASNFWKKIQ